MSLKGLLTIISISYSLWCGIGNWGCARGFGRGTLYMKWGHEGLKNEKENKRENNESN